MANQERTVGKIELKLQDLGQLFDTLDPSPFRERSLDHDAEAFIVSWARDLRHADEFEILLHLAKAAAKPELAPSVVEAVHNHFAYLTDAKRREFRALMSRGRRSLAIGVAFLAACLLLGNAVGRVAVDHSELIGIVKESLVIGGWVAMWRPIEIFLYDWWALRREQRDYERLSRAQVRIAESG
ncbi:MAG TPA: hypothetical protein VEI82_14025 [Myxococcota bacterium]|nr:hypothetical protein [Myxococcota bacterium]